MKAWLPCSALVGLATAVAMIGIPTAARAAVTEQEGTAFTATVASPTCLASSPTIDWGDGTGVSTATVVSDNTNNTIQGTHTYRIAGSYNGTASYACTQIGKMFSVPFTVTVSDAPLTLVAVTLSGTVGVALSGVVAHLTDANPLSSSADFSATVNWGDGTSTVGSVAATAAGGYDVTAAHGYTSAGSYTVTTNITDPGGGTSATSIATITAPPQTTIISGPNNGVDIWTTAPVYKFTSTVPGSTFECMVDDGAFAPCASGRFIGPLDSGEHTFHVRAVSPAGVVDPAPAAAFFSVGSRTGFKADDCQATILPYPAHHNACKTVIGKCPTFATCTITGAVTMTDADGDGRYFPFEGANVTLNPAPGQASCGNNVYRPDKNFGYYQQYVTTHGCHAEATETVFGKGGPKVVVGCTAFMSYVGAAYVGDGAQRLFTCAGHMTIAPTTPLAARLAKRLFQVFVASYGVLKVTATPAKRSTATKLWAPIVSRTIQVQHAGVVSIPFTLTTAERADLRRRGSLRLRLDEAFTPTGGTTNTRITPFTIRLAGRIPTPHCPIARCPAIKNPGHA